MPPAPKDRPRLSATLLAALLLLLVLVLIVQLMAIVRGDGAYLQYVMGLS